MHKVKVVHRMMNYSQITIRHHSHMNKRYLDINNNSNIIKLIGMLRAVERITQMIWYL